MATKKNTPKRNFNRKHLLWIIPLAIVVVFAAGIGIPIWRDYEDDRNHFSSVVESNQRLTDTVYGLMADRTDVVVTYARDYCTYDQGKFGREGPPECGREVVLRSTDLNTREEVSKILTSKIRELSEVDEPLNRIHYERHCGVYRDFSTEGGLAARCSQNMKRWAMYPDFPDRTYN